MIGARKDGSQSSHIHMMVLDKDETCPGLFIFYSRLGEFSSLYSQNFVGLGLIRNFIGPNYVRSLHTQRRFSAFGETIVSKSAPAIDYSLHHRAIAVVGLCANQS